MKLYYSPGACSLGSHIALYEAGLPFDAEKVDLREKKTATGADYYTINDKGYVPALGLDDGGVLTENAAVLQYIADRAPASGLAPPAGTLARYRLAEWLHYIGTEVHKVFSLLFNPNLPEDQKAATIKTLHRKFDYVAKRLGAGQYLMGDTFTVADAYLYAVLNWTHGLQIDLVPWPALQQYLARIAARPKALQALKAEGLVK
jgi:glutathione S-transferase